MFPVILRDGAQPWIAAGASGGRRIMAAVLQLLWFVTDFGMTPEAAAHQPRIDVSGPDKVTADRRLAPEIIRALQADGPVEIVEHGVLPINFACPNLLMQRTACAPASATRLRPGPRRSRRRDAPSSPLRRAKGKKESTLAFLIRFSAASARMTVAYFFNTRTGLPASHALMSSTICV